VFETLELNMAALCNLPFPIQELSWERFDEVRAHLKVSKAEAFQVMLHVLGAPPKPLHDP